eukprot:12594905-Prorocentrum_lima.AAC.1
MTSSLVGSEMCIRDSPSPLSAIGRVTRSGDEVYHEGVPLSPLRSEIVFSVSYTHLTLPTICSV